MWDDLCPDVKDEIRKHLNLADHLRMRYVSRDFHSASHAQEAAAQERLLAIARSAFSHSFLTNLGQALEFPIDGVLDENGARGTQILEQTTIQDDCVPLLNPPSEPDAPGGLWLKVTMWRLTFAGAGLASFLFAVEGSSRGSDVWAYLTIFRLSPSANPFVWLWVDPQHAISTFSLLCSACIDGMPSRCANTPPPSSSFTASQTLAQDARLLMALVSRGRTHCAQRARELEGEIVAGAVLLSRSLGRLRITGAPSPWWGERALHVFLLSLRMSFCHIPVYVFVLWGKMADAVALAVGLMAGGVMVCAVGFHILITEVMVWLESLVGHSSVQRW